MDHCGEAVDLKEARIRNFFSMAKLADKAKVSVATIRDVESGRQQPSLTTCAKLAAALSMSPEAIAECQETMQRLLEKGNKIAKRILRK